MAGKTYITGASGRLGGAVLKKIDAIPLSRRASGLKEEIVTDFSKEDLQKILKDAETIVHIAGSINTLEKEKMWKANVDVTRNIVEAAPEDARIVFAGSISVYGKRMAAIPANEDTPVNPDTDYARSKYEAEKLVRQHKNHVILRIGVIYGPQFRIYFDVMRMIGKNRIRIIGEGNNRVPFVHVDDVADVFANALTKGKGTYIVAGDSTTQKQVIEMVCKELGAKKPKHISLNAAMLFAAFGEVWYRITGKRPKLTREEVSILGNDRAFNCNKARRELGFSPRPLEDGMDEMIAEYRKITNQ